MTPSCAGLLEGRLLPALTPRLADAYGLLLRRLHLGLQELQVAPMFLLGGHSESTDKVLEHVEALMHEMAAIEEYLGKVVDTLLSAVPRGAKQATAIKKRLSYVVARDFQVPVNLVKHDSFRLCWTGQIHGGDQTFGFYLSGLVAPRVIGPGNAKLSSSTGKPMPIDEAYSFAWFFRRVLPTFFELCHIVEDALRAAKCFEPHCSPSMRMMSPAHVEILKACVALSGGLPIRCFPHENKRRVETLALNENGALMVAATFRLVSFKQYIAYMAISVRPEPGQLVKLPGGAALAVDEDGKNLLAPRPNAIGWSAEAVA